MSTFTEIEYLRGQPLVDPAADDLVIAGYAGSGMATSKKFRDVVARDAVKAG
jgi:hypothetical protein